MADYSDSRGIPSILIWNLILLLYLTRIREIKAWKSEEGSK
jgi:hypothetical protein